MQRNQILLVRYFICFVAVCCMIPASVLIQEFPTKNEVNSPKRMFKIFLPNFTHLEWLKSLAWIMNSRPESTYVVSCAISKAFIRISMWPAPQWYD